VRQALLLAALCLFGLGAALSALWGTARRGPRSAAFGAGAIGSALVVAAGLLSVLGPAQVLSLGDLSGFASTSAVLDPLAGGFLVLTGGLGALVSVASLGWEPAPAAPGERVGAVAYFMLLASVTAVVVAGDVFSFLFAWELLTVAFYLLSAASRDERGQPGSAWATAGVGKAGGASLLVGFLLLAGQAGSFGLAAWRGLGPGELHDVAYSLLVFGFATKVGLTPFQVWMPKGYPAAPGPMRAAMAGVAVNAGFYGLWRTLALLGRPPLWLVVAVLVLGGFTALLGASFAAVDGDLARVVSFSSSENGGIIMVAFGVALTGAYVRDGRLLAVGLLAASLQVLAHAVAKTGLFLATSEFEAATGTTLLDKIRGMAQARPFSAAAFAASSLTLAALPPTIGFVSEWFVLESLMQQFRVGSLALRLAMAAAGAFVALSSGVAALAFVRLLSFVALSPQRVPNTSRAALASNASAFFVALSCLGLAAFAPWVVRFLAKALRPVATTSASSGALASPWVLQPVFAHFSALSPSWLAVVLPAGSLAVLSLTAFLSKGGFFVVRRVPAWRSASPGVHGEDSYSAFAYANPARHVLANILGTKKQVSSLPPIEGGNGHRHIVFSSWVNEPLETYLWRPAVAGYLSIVAAAKRLQCGRLGAYIAYMLVALMATLVVSAAVH
jgi:hydrogenase-4 component B